MLLAGSDDEILLETIACGIDKREVGFDALSEKERTVKAVLEAEELIADSIDSTRKMSSE